MVEQTPKHPSEKILRDCIQQATTHDEFFQLLHEHELTGNYFHHFNNLPAKMSERGITLTLTVNYTRTGMQHLGLLDDVQRFDEQCTAHKAVLDNESSSLLERREAYRQLALTLSRFDSENTKVKNHIEMSSPDLQLQAHISKQAEEVAAQCNGLALLEESTIRELYIAGDTEAKELVFLTAKKLVLEDGIAYETLIQ